MVPSWGSLKRKKNREERPAKGVRDPAPFEVPKMSSDTWDILLSRQVQPPHRTKRWDEEAPKERRFADAPGQRQYDNLRNETPRDRYNGGQARFQGRRRGDGWKPRNGYEPGDSQYSDGPPRRAAPVNDVVDRFSSYSESREARTPRFSGGAWPVQRTNTDGWSQPRQRYDRGESRHTPRQQPTPSPSTESFDNFMEHGGISDSTRHRPRNVGSSGATSDWAASFGIDDSGKAPIIETGTGDFNGLIEEGSRWGGFQQRQSRHRRLEQEDRPERERTPRKPYRRASRLDQSDEWDDEVSMFRNERKRERAAAKAQQEREAAAKEPRQILVPEFISVTGLAHALTLKPAKFLETLKELGFEDLSEESLFTGETAGLIAQEYGFEVTIDDGETRDLKARPVAEDPSTVPSRPPVVAIMGHIDHGKTTLLDYLRKSSVAAQEHGGITQHIGAFVVKMSSGKPITFLDTPGHAAFLAMRQRGAEVTDIVVLVVAADDSVMPQTLEALKHARDAKVPIIVAITKVDKPEARVETVKRDLSSHGVEIEDFGGDVQVVCVSGKTGQGMSELEDNILALSEILDVRGETDGIAEGWVLEASIKPVGKAATVLVKRGTLRPGDFVVAGTTFARVRALRNDAGQEIDEAPPGTPAEVLGWRDELPDAGDSMIQAEDESRARRAVDYRNEMKERQSSFDQAAAEERERRETEAKAKAAEETAAEGEAEAKDGTPATDNTSTSGMITVNFIVKGDVVGSVEAVCSSIQEIGSNEIRPRILSAGAGQISESDIEYAATADAVLVNFNTTVPGHIRSMAQASAVQVIDRSVIYHLADDIRAVMTARLPPRVVQKVVGEADVLQVFAINLHKRVYKNIAGCVVRNGIVHSSDKVRVMRQGTKVFDGTCEFDLAGYLHEFWTQC